MTRLRFLSRIREAVAVFTVSASLMALSGCDIVHLPPAHDSDSETAPASDSRQQALDLYHEAWQIVFNDYVDPSFNGQNWYIWKDRYDKRIQTQEDSYAAIRTMLASLNDPYSRFLNPRNAQDQNMHIDSRLYGVGIQLAEKEGQPVVVAVIDDSPAKKAGILPLDKITAVDTVATAQMPLEQIVDKIRGPKGKPVSLTIDRKGQIKPYKLIRDEITIKTVFGDPVSKDIGYIRLSSFISQDAADEMMAKLGTQKNTRALIVDLRGNNGGLMQNALEISDMFLRAGKIVSILDRSGSRREFNAKPSALYDKPLVILIDGGSASASEIMAGALKDDDRATLIGEKSFGKGLVQKINYLQDGSELNLTISKYFTPAGHDINKKGILPDIEVPLSESDFLHNRDPQKAAAVRFLKHKLQGRAS